MSLALPILSRLSPRVLLGLKLGGATGQSLSRLERKGLGSSLGRESPGISLGVEGLILHSSAGKRVWTVTAE